MCVDANPALTVSTAALPDQFAHFRTSSRYDGTVAHEFVEMGGLSWVPLSTLLTSGGAYCNSLCAKVVRHAAVRATLCRVYDTVALAIDAPPSSVVFASESEGVSAVVPATHAPVGIVPPRALAPVVDDGGRYGAGVDNGRYGAGVDDIGRNGAVVHDGGRYGAVVDDGRYGAGVDYPHYGVDDTAWHRDDVGKGGVVGDAPYTHADASPCVGADSDASASSALPGTGVKFDGAGVLLYRVAAPGTAAASPLEGLFGVLSGERLATVLSGRPHGSEPPAVTAVRGFTAATHDAFDDNTVASLFDVVSGLPVECGTRDAAAAAAGDWPGDETHTSVWLHDGRFVLYIVYAEDLSGMPDSDAVVEAFAATVGRGRRRPHRAAADGTLNLGSLEWQPLVVPAETDSEPSAGAVVVPVRPGKGKHAPFDDFATWIMGDDQVQAWIRRANDRALTDSIEDLVAEVQAAIEAAEQERPGLQVRGTGVSCDTLPCVCPQRATWGRQGVQSVCTCVRCIVLPKLHTDGYE